MSLVPKVIKKRPYELTVKTAAQVDDSYNVVIDKIGQPEAFGMSINELAKLTSNPDLFVEESIDQNSEAFKDDSQTDGGNEYLMIPRITKNPADGTLITCYGIFDSHTSKTQYFFLRKSLDNGKTWTGLNGTGTQTKVTTTDYGHNWTAMFTATGRLLIFYQYATGPSATRSKAKVMYSDNLGTTWSTPYEIAYPTIDDVTYPPYFFDNKAIYNDDGNLVTSYWVRVVESGRVLIGIAESADDGATWDTDYSFVFYNGLSGQLGEITEHSMVDCGEGIFVMISRLDTNNADGFCVPVIMTSLDYGRNWAGTSTTLATSNLVAKEHHSGYAYLEGPGKTMGVPTYDISLPQMNIVEYENEKWLIINYWRRDDGVNRQDWMVTLINVREFMLYGVDAIKTDNYYLPYLIHHYANNGSGNVNGGNGCAIDINNELILTNYNQTTSYSSNGTTELNYAFLSANVINKMIEAYRNVGFNTSKVITFNSTESVMDFAKTKTAEITLTGNVTLLTIDNIADHESGEIVIIQNGTGGYGIAAVENENLTSKYIDGNVPSSANINSGANAHTVLSFKRIGDYLYVTFGKFDTV